MKKIVEQVCSFYDGHRKKLLMMRNAVLIILISAFQVLATGSYSQTAQLSLNLKDATIKEVLTEIENQSEFYFLYNSELIDVTRKVDISVKNEKVNDILSRLFSDNEVNVSISDRHIVLTPVTEMSEQQQKIVSGIVTDESGQPLPGVTVVVTGSTTGTITNSDGNFSLSIPDGTETLQFSFVGMRTQEISLDGKTTFTVVMEEENIGIEEVVAVGYGTQRKSDLTGAISQVKMANMENKEAISVADYLRGAIAGLNISRSSSLQGSQNFEVRGPTSIGTNTSPLLVVDGMIYQGMLNDINPNDINTVDVLKDASSAAIYGSRAAAGVILITTKQGKTEKPTINFNTKFGVASLLRKQEAYDVDGYLNMRGYAILSKQQIHIEDPEYFRNPNQLQNIELQTWLNYDANIPSDADPIQLWLQRLQLYPVEIDNYNAGKSVDWIDKVFQTGILQDYNVSVSGKSKALNYYWSLGALDNKGIVYNDSYQNIRSRINITSDITEFLQVGIRTNFATNSSNSYPADWERAFEASPLGSLYEEDGTYTRFPNTDNVSRNPLDVTQYNQYERNFNITGSTWAILKLPFGIEYQINYDNRWRFSSDYTYRPSYTVAALQENGSTTREEYKQYDWSLDNILRWERIFDNKHKVNLTLLYNSSRWESMRTQANASDFSISEILTYHALDIGGIPTVSSDDQVETRESYMARLNYSFEDRYLLTALVRRDGYSAFGQYNPWGTFPSLAIGWRLSEENFMKNINSVSNLKLRLSYGVNGNSDIGRYAALSKVASSTYLQGHEKTTVISLYPISMPNSSLQWEQTSSLNAGIDLGLFNQRLNFTVDAYYMSTTDMLLPRTLPTLTGYTTITSNMGQLDNKGLELTINSINVKNSNLQWNTDFTFSMNRNEIVHLYGDMIDVLDESGNVIGQKEADDPTNDRYIGHSLDAIYDYKIIGVWQSDEAELAAKYGRLPGDFKTLDPINPDDHQFSPADYIWQGYSSPRFRFSMRNSFTIANAIDISFLLRSDVGHKKTFNEPLDSKYPDRISAMAFPYWTPDNPTNEWGRLGGGKTGNIYRNASFVRIDDFSIGYRFPKRLLQKIHSQEARIFINIDNVYSFDNWPYWDPETRNPTPTTFTFGINLTL